MSRTIQSRPARVRSVAVPGDVLAWLHQQAGQIGARYLLAHADDGVIWGRFDDGRLITSHEVTFGTPGGPVGPPLRALTLQQARVFGQTGELLIWRENGDRFVAREIVDCDDADATWREAIDEPYLLWGTSALARDRGFTLLTEGSQGLRHALPIALRSGSIAQRPAVRVRHYLAEDEIGRNRVVVSRLVDLNATWKGFGDD